MGLASHFRNEEVTKRNTLWDIESKCTMSHIVMRPSKLHESLEVVVGLAKLHTMGQVIYFANVKHVWRKFCLDSASCRLHRRYQVPLRAECCSRYSAQNRTKYECTIYCRLYWTGWLAELVFFLILFMFHLEC